jgi:hypothetical protein
VSTVERLHVTTATPRNTTAFTEAAPFHSILSAYELSLVVGVELVIGLQSRLESRNNQPKRSKDLELLKRIHLVSARNRSYEQLDE